MKKTLLAATILTSLISAAHAGVTVFKDDSNQVDLKARVYAGYISQENNDADTSNGESDAYFRLGFNTKSQLSEDLKAISKLEIQWAIADDGKQDTTKTRLAYAGIQGDWGAITFGRQYRSNQLLVDWTDTGVSNQAPAALNGFGRESNVLQFEGTYIDALTLSANVQLESDQDGIDKSGLGLGATYAFDFGLNLGATYGVETKDDIDTTTTLLGAKYKISDLTAAVVMDFTSTDNNADSTALETSLAYSFGKASVVTRYLQQDIDGQSDLKMEQITLGAAYKFNKKFRLVAEYIADQVEGEENLFTFAARYDF